MMATACGITMSECRLLPEGDCNHFMTRRFDRTLSGEKIHMQTAAGIAHLDRDVRHSHEELFGVLRRLGLNYKDFEQLYRRTVFNVIARNHDDHTKNFSFLMDKTGHWSFAPAYDVCYSYDPAGRWTSRHQLSLNSKTDDFNREDLLAVAQNIGIRDANEDDLIDNRIFGNIFHLAAKLLYERLTMQSPVVTKEAINRLLDTEADIHRAVDEAIREELSSPLSTLNGLQLINREVIIHYIHQLLEIDRRLAPFTILGLERLVKMPYRIASTGERFDIGGTIDRLDLITVPDGTERIRVIDYKTGGHRLKPLPDVDAVFAPESLKDHSDYYLQTFLYSHIVSNSAKGKPVSPGLLFIQHAGGDDYDPTLCLGKEPVDDISVIAEPFMTHLDAVVADIFNPDGAFVATDDPDRCRHCPYAALCRL